MDTELTQAAQRGYDGAKPPPAYRSSAVGMAYSLGEHLRSIGSERPSRVRSGRGYRMWCNDRLYNDDNSWEREDYFASCISCSKKLRKEELDGQYSLNSTVLYACSVCTSNGAALREMDQRWNKLSAINFKSSST